MSFSQAELLASGQYFRACEIGDQHGSVVHDKDGINVEYHGHTERFLATSTRGIIIGRESYLGRPLKGGLGFVCAANIRPDERTGRIQSEYVLGGGKLKRDFNTRPPVGDYDIEETVRACAVREIGPGEELDIPLSPENLLLFAVRTITEGQSNEPKRERGCIAVDALFFAVAMEKLGYYGGQKGETGERQVRSAAELLREVSYDERRRGVLPPLFRTQGVALATGILAINDMLRDELPPEWQALIDESVVHAKRFMDSVEKSSPHLHSTTTRVIQQREWQP